MLDEAAAELNARGVSGADLGAVAERVGVSRAALYYYFESRESLVVRCYERACERLAEDLAAAAAEVNGLERILALIERALDPEHPPGLALTEVPRLSTKARRAIEDAHRQNVTAFEGFVAAGVADGSVRGCDAAIACHTILGILAWVPLAEIWVEGLGEDWRARCAAALAGLVGEGVAADPARPVVCPLDVTSFRPAPANAFDPRETRATKIEQLTRTASRLFNRNGIDGTSLDDVTSALGATKGAFYHYLADKEDLVVRCYRRAYDLYERFADAAEKAGRDGFERGFFGLHLNVQAHVAGLAPLAPLSGLEALPRRARDELKRRSQELGRRFESYGRDGIADGSLRAFDVRPVAIAGAGAFAWIPKWLAEDDPRPARLVADEIVSLFARGLRRR